MSEAVVVKCSHCGQKLKAPVTRLGKTVKCPKCQQDFVLQAAEQIASPTAAPVATPAPTAAPVSAQQMPAIATAKPLATAKSIPATPATANPLPHVNPAATPISSTNPFDFLAQSAAATNSLNVPVAATPATPSITVANPVPTLAHEAGLWSLRISNGTVYGPVPRAELDRWYAEGRIDDSCAVQQAGDATWQLPSMLFATSTAPTANAGSPILASIAQPVVDNNPYGITSSASGYSTTSRFGGLQTINWPVYRSKLMMTMICCGATATFYLILFFLQWSAIRFLMKMDFSNKSAAIFKSLMNFIGIDALLLFATLLIQFIFWLLMLKPLPNGQIKQWQTIAVGCKAIAGFLFIVLVGINLSKGASTVVNGPSYFQVFLQIGLNLFLIAAYLSWSYSLLQAANQIKPKSVNTLFFSILGVMAIRVLCLLLTVIPNKLQLYADIAQTFFAAVSLTLIAVLIWMLNSMIQRISR